MKEEKRLFKALKSKNQMSSFEYFYKEYKPLVAFVLSKYINSTNDIDDLINETFLEFFNHAQEVRTSVKGYLLSKARSIAINFLRKNNRMYLVDSFDIDNLQSDKSSISHHHYLDVITLMKRILEKNDVEIILMHIEEGLSFKEIGTIKKISENTVKSRYFRALNKIRKRGKKYE